METGPATGTFVGIVLSAGGPFSSSAISAITHILLATMSDLVKADVASATFVFFVDITSHTLDCCAVSACANICLTYNFG